MAKPKPRTQAAIDARTLAATVALNSVLNTLNLALDESQDTLDFQSFVL